jgi:hypothetical protein
LHSLQEPSREPKESEKGSWSAPAQQDNSQNRDKIHGISGSMEDMGMLAMVMAAVHGQFLATP